MSEFEMLIEEWENREYNRMKLLWKQYRKLVPPTKLEDMKWRIVKK